MACHVAQAVGDCVVPERRPYSEHGNWSQAEIHRRARRGSAGTLARLRSCGARMLRRRTLASRSIATISQRTSPPLGGDESERRRRPERASLACRSGCRCCLNGRSTGASRDARIGARWLHTRTPARISSGVSQRRRKAIDLRLSRHRTTRHTRSAARRARRGDHPRRPHSARLSGPR